MNSLDTNMLICALDEEAPGHDRRSPLDASTALDVVDELRNRSNARCVAYQTSQWKELTRLLERVGNRKGLLVFDAVLAVTLKAAGGKYFNTRNVSMEEGRLPGLRVKFSEPGTLHEGYCVPSLARRPRLRALESIQ